MNFPVFQTFTKGMESRNIRIMKVLRHMVFSLTLWLSFTGVHAQKGQLIVFLSEPEQPVVQDFIANYLKRLQSLAEDLMLDWKVVDVQSGAPELISYTPAIVFQNHLGRSLYIGRYSYPDKVKTFVRSVRRMPQQAVSNEKHDVMIRTTGRLTIVNPVKITAMTGYLPKGFDNVPFRKRAFSALDEGMKAYRYQEKWEAQRNNRLVYTAFYPYRSENGRFFLSAEMYSQFNCIVPVFRHFEVPIQCSWRDWPQAFVQAGAMMEARIDSLFSHGGGDGLVALADGIPVKTWEELGLDLPQPEPGKAANLAILPDVLPLKWEFGGVVEDGIPVVGFSFPAPLEYYAGEINRIAANLIFLEKMDLQYATGSFQVDMKELTMGDPELDDAVQGMLKMAEYPKSEFQFTGISKSENPVLRFGFSSQFLAEGTFHFMGVAAPLEVEATMEPIMNEQDEVRLMVNAKFQIHLKERYGVKGPDGPDDAKDTVLFDLNFLMKPA